MLSVILVFIIITIITIIIIIMFIYTMLPSHLQDPEQLSYACGKGVASQASSPQEVCPRIPSQLELS